MSRPENATTCTRPDITPTSSRENSADRDAPSCWNAHRKKR